MEQKCYIKFLELLAIALELVMMKFKSIHIQVDNLTALIYFFKMAETKSQKLPASLTKIREYLFKYQIIIIADYLLKLLIC